MKRILTLALVGCLAAGFAAVADPAGAQEYDRYDREVAPPPPPPPPTQYRSTPSSPRPRPRNTVPPPRLPCGSASPTEARISPRTSVFTSRTAT